jgi:hypothetical protein
VARKGLGYSTEGTGVSYSSNTSLLYLQRLQHTSFASLNQCAFAKINKFFQTGALPVNDNYCSLEAGPRNITLTGPLDKRDDVARSEQDSEIYRGDVDTVVPTQKPPITLSKPIECRVSEVLTI